MALWAGAALMLFLALPGVAAAAHTFTLDVAPKEWDARYGESNVSSTPVQARVFVTEDGGPVTFDTTVTLMSSSPGSLAVNNVTILAGQTSAAITYSALAQNPDVTVTAWLGSIEDHTTHVNVVGAGQNKMGVTPFDVANKPTGSQQTLTAQFVGPGGPVTPAHVRFSVTGANPRQAVEGTNGTDSSTFSYTGTNPGQDDVTVCYDPDDDSVCDNTKHAKVMWAAPAASVTPAAVAFPDTAPGAQSAGQTVTVANTGTVPLPVSSAALIDAGAGQFAKTTDTCSGTSVAVGDSCTVSVAFAPTAAGAASARLRISDGSSTSPHDVALSGTGVAPAASGDTGNTPAGTTTNGDTPATGPSPSPIGPVGPAAGGQSSVLPPSNAFRLVSVKPDKKRGELGLVVHTDTPGTVVVKATEKKKPRSVASVSGHVAGGANVTLRLRPSRAARKLLRSKGRLRAALQVTFTPDGGKANTVARSATFALSRKR
jgi:hypothetical protein